MFNLNFTICRDEKRIELGSLFLLLALYVILSGLLLYAGMRLLLKIIRFTSTVLTLVEYYIQWSLLYVTVYQAIFSNVNAIKALGSSIKVGDFLDPNLFVVMVLPSFISVWIAIVLYKKYLKLI